MTIEAFEVEGEASRLYRAAGVDPAREPSALRIALAHPCVRLEVAPRMRPRASIRETSSGHVIRLDSRLPPIAIEWLCGHELGHFARGLLDCTPENERVCSQIAACIVAPRPAMYLLRHAFGIDVARIAVTLGTSQTIVALRWGEVFEEPVALVTAATVRRRGPDGLPSDRELRAIVAARGSDTTRVVELTDAKGALVIGQESA